MAELSIIVPIYNVEKYLVRCIDSILSQTYKDFELILVNDGSPDKCDEIIEYYAQKDNRIVTIHQENKGVSAARNAGLKIATGKYVGFVDPDDWIANTMYEKMITDMTDVQADIACCNWHTVREDGTKVKHLVHEIERQMTREEFMIQIFSMPRTVGGSTCNKLFLKEKIKDFFDEHQKICEDNLFLLQYCLQISKAVYVYHDLYYIYERQNSATRKVAASFVIGLPVRYRMIQLSSFDDKVKNFAEKDYLDICFFCFKQLQSKISSEDCCVAKKYFRKYFRKNIIHILKNPQIYWKTKLLYLVELLKTK